MSKVVIFGAGGRAGRQAVLESHRRGYQVTAVVRDPAKHAGLAGDGVRLIAGDVTDAASVAALARGHNAAINAAADLTADFHYFFTKAARALAKGLSEAEVGRLVAVGLASILPNAAGTLLMDEPGYPQEFRAFYLAHAAELDVLRSSALDWLYVSPAGDFDHDAPPSGRYRISAHGDTTSRISYPDFAIAVLDEIETPTHHHTHLAVSS